MKKLFKLVLFSLFFSYFANASAHADDVIESLESLNKVANSASDYLTLTNKKNLQAVSKYSLKNKIDFQNTYKKVGVISHKFKKYNIWAIKDNLSLDGKERKVVTITLNDKDLGDIIEAYYIEYYQDGTIEFRKNFDPTNSRKNQWIISYHPEGVNWYSQRQYYWVLDGDKEQTIGRWKTRSNNKWLYGIFNPNPKDSSQGLWEVFGYKKNKLKTQTGISKKEQQNLFKEAKKRSSEAEDILKLLLNLQKKFYSKVENKKSTFETADKDLKDTDNSYSILNTHNSADVNKQTHDEILKKIEKEKQLLAEEKAKLQNELEKLRNQLTTKENPTGDKKLFQTDEKYYALVIGNNNYNYLEKLDAAEKDAEIISEILKNKYGFQVNLLLNADYDTTVNSLFKITKKLKKNDNLLIYYAGHGEIDKAEDRGYWLPVDASYEMRSKWVSNQIIVDRIKATKAKHVLLIADSCFSGTLMRSGSLPNKSENIDKKYIERLKKKKTRLVITSGGNEPVVDSVGGKHSLFALKLIDTLKNNNSVINSQILFENIRRYVVANADQTPERAMVHKTGHDGGDFLFFPVN